MRDSPVHCEYPANKLGRYLRHYRARVATGARNRHGRLAHHNRLLRLLLELLHGVIGIYLALLVSKAKLHEVVQLVLGYCWLELLAELDLRLRYEVLKFLVDVAGFGDFLLTVVVLLPQRLEIERLVEALRYSISLLYFFSDTVRLGTNRLLDRGQADRRLRRINRLHDRLFSLAEHGDLLRKRRRCFVRGLALLLFRLWYGILVLQDQSHR